MRNTALNLYIFTTLCALISAGCEKAHQEHRYTPTVSAGLEFELCQTPEGEKDPNGCPCGQVCAMSYSVADPSGLYICMDGCIDRSDCWEGYRCGEGGYCTMDDQVTADNTGTCVRSAASSLVRTDTSGPDTQGSEDTSSGVDNDGDGVEPPLDCDDNNPNVYPGAEEVCGNGIDDNCDNQTDEGCEVDADEDHYVESEDCDDHNDTVYPGALEVCDGLDNDCDGETDEGDACQTDVDGDGYAPPEDCDDNDFYTHPAAYEECDGVDNDCDGETDEGCPGNQPVCGNGVCEVGETKASCPLDCEEEVVDLDSDGYSPPQDCDDTDYYVNPGMVEVCDGKDNDCDGATDEGVCGPQCPNGICEAGEAETCPQDCGGPVCGNSVCEAGEAQTCPQDCGPVCGDGVCEQGETSTCPQDCITDRDGDSYPPSEDCDDTDYYVNPGAQEVCDGKDNDCDGQTDEGCVVCGNGVCEAGEADTCPQDCGPVCGDGVCEAGEAQTCPQDCGPICGNGVCEAGEIGVCTQDCGSGEIDNDNDGYPLPQDCNDNNYYIHPGADEACDGVDNDCDGQTDEGCTDCGNGTCEVGENAQNCPQDCGPYCGNGLCEAGEAQTCPQDCGGQIDVDGDGYSPPEDCDDYNYYVNPGAQEVCDGKDNDCDGQTDEGCVVCGNDICEAGESYTTCPQDCDPVCGNGVCEGNEAQTCPQDCGPVCGNDICEAGETQSCPQDCLEDKDGDGYYPPNDCDDYNYYVHPGAQEVCDGIDNDCDGQTDEGCGYCGDDICQSDENAQNCPLDCGGSICGNNIRESGEQCDGNDFDGLDCGDYDYQSGYLTCNSNCTVNTSHCYNQQDDQSGWVAKKCENGWNCIELNSQYLDYMSVYVVGDCPPLGMYDYDGVWNPAGRIQVFDTDNDGFFELWLDDADSWYDCEISWIVEDPNPNNNWSWAQYEGACLSNPDPEGMCGPYLNCGYNGNGEYVCNVHFETPDGDPSGVIE